MENKSNIDCTARAESAFRFSPVDLQCIERALAYIEKHYYEKISAEQLSMEVGISKEKLQAGLQLRKGKTLHKYIQGIRLEKAKELLVNTNDPVKAVAGASGFVNESHFCKVFKKMHCISPVQYRFSQAW